MPCQKRLWPFNRTLLKLITQISCPIRAQSSRPSVVKRPLPADHTWVPDVRLRPSDPRSTRGSTILRMLRPVWLCALGRPACRIDRGVGRRSRWRDWMTEPNQGLTLTPMWLRSAMTFGSVSPRRHKSWRMRSSRAARAFGRPPSGGGRPGIVRRHQPDQGTELPGRSWSRGRRHRDGR